MTYRPELLDELLKNYQHPDDLVGEGGLLKQLTAALVERCLTAEMDHHLEVERAEPAEAETPLAAMDTARRRLRGNLVKLRLPFHETGTGRLNR
jgi:transposase-like protein